jgi:hypothetical protein
VGTHRIEDGELDQYRGMHMLPYVVGKQKRVCTPSTNPAITRQKIMCSHILLMSSRHTAMTSA